MWRSEPHIILVRVTALSRSCSLHFSLTLTRSSLSLSFSFSLSLSLPLSLYRCTSRRPEALAANGLYANATIAVPMLSIKGVPIVDLGAQRKCSVYVE